MVSIKQINYALAVEKEMHFKNAADKCFVSASTLSNAISEMEKQLGFEIFERNNKKVIVTKKTIEDTDEQANNGASPVIKDFVIYPNPSSGVFSLELKLKEISDVNVKIYSLLSNNLIDYKEVKEQEEYKIDYNLNLVPGMYFVLIETQNEKLVKKIIIK